MHTLHTYPLIHAHSFHATVCAGQIRSLESEAEEEASSHASEAEEEIEDLTAVQQHSPSQLMSAVAQVGNCSPLDMALAAVAADFGDMPEGVITMVVEGEALVVYARILASRLPLKMTGN